MFFHFTTVLQLFCCSPALLLLYRIATVLKAGEQQHKWRTTLRLVNSGKAVEQQQSWKTTIKLLY
jgi:hypothetical protein